MVKGAPRALLVVDGYNVLFADPRYQDLFDEPDGSVPERLGTDPFGRAREALLADVAAYAQHEYEAVIVYDGANNRGEHRPETRRGGVREVISRRGVSADTVIEGLVTEARDSGRRVTVVTSDGTIQATVEGPGVTRVSSRMLVHEVAAMNRSIEREREERTWSRMSLEDRLDPETAAKLNALLGRRV